MAPLGGSGSIRALGLPTPSFSVLGFRGLEVDKVFDKVPECYQDFGLAGYLDSTIFYFYILCCSILNYPIHYFSLLCCAIL